MKKNSNIVSSDKNITVQIFEGLTLMASCDTYTSTQEAYSAAKRIIDHQKKISGDSFSAYAMVFENKKMLYYFD